jgi:hypothetical protein
MPPRFATTEQIEFVAEQETNINDYHAQFDAVLTAFAGLIEAFSPESGIETRAITPKGRDDEEWRGMLLSASSSNSVDVWCLTFTGTQFLDDKENGAGYFKKPFTLAIDYFLDYDFGTDEDNTESVFSKKIDTLEFLIEQLRTNPDFECLPSCVIVLSGAIKRGIKTFSDASTHFAKGDILLQFENDVD